MPTVLHLSAAEPTWWSQTASGWSPVPPAQALAATDPVWVVADMAEEVFAEITVPRIFGADRASYVQRQLVARFPESKFRIALPPSNTGGLMERLAPPRQILAAVEPSERIEAALQALQIPPQRALAGVWSSSMLLARLGQKSSMPSDMFVVLCQGGSMRIVFLKDRIPVLTRQLSGMDSVQDQAAEVVRTLRHLENTRVVERGTQRFGMLALGAAQGLTNLLERDRMDALPVPAPWGVRAPQDWSHVLFDLACKSPAGQLAPLSYRATFVAAQWRLAARVASVVCVLGAVGLASSSLLSVQQSRQSKAQLQTQLAHVATQVAAADQAIARTGVDPQRVRAAIALDDAEVSTVPPMGVHMLQLSHALASVPGARLSTMQWTLREPTEAACVNDAAAPSTPPEDMAMQTEQAPMRKVELLFAVQLPDTSSPRVVAQQAATLSAQVRSIPGAQVVQDPAPALREGAIQVSNAADTSKYDLQWCMTLKGQP